MSDQVLLYRGLDLIADSDLIVDSLDAGTLLVGGLNVKPVFITKFSTTNINNALSTPLIMDASGEVNNIPTALAKFSTSVIEAGVDGAGTYYVSMVLNVTASTSSVQIQFLKGVSVISVANISPSDSGCILSFPVVLAVGDTLSFNSVRVGGGNAVKNLFPTSSALYITKL
jgi:hypothetical protein